MTLNQLLDVLSDPKGLEGNEAKDVLGRSVWFYLEDGATPLVVSNVYVNNAGIICVNLECAPGYDGE